MKQMLLIVLFLTVSPLIIYKYYRVKLNKTWDDARTYCRTYHIDLATIYSEASRLKLRAISSLQFRSDAWYGVYKESHNWLWSYKTESLGPMTKWGPKNLFRSNYEEECAVIRSDGLWYDYPCATKCNFVCYDETQNSKYIYIQENSTWFEAQSYCRLHHTDLASARDETENSIITLMVSEWDAWFGLTRITWRWLDQTNEPTITWMPGQPDNSLGGEHCGYLADFNAADAQCSDMKLFVCYRIITGQIQMVRFKVRSDQNLNDPVVKAALLEKILQKLMQHGMVQNIRQKWRK